MTKIKHINRMSRDQPTRMLKTASLEQLKLNRRANKGGEGLTCNLCSPRPWNAAEKHESKEHAALEEIFEALA